MKDVYMSQVTLSKEGSSGDYSLEAGALVLGDQGRFILTAQLFRSSLKFSFPSASTTTTFLLFSLHHHHRYLTETFIDIKIYLNDLSNRLNNLNIVNIPILMGVPRILFMR